PCARYGCRGLRSAAPSPGPYLERLQNANLDDLNNEDEGNGVSQDERYVKELEGNVELISNPVRATEQLNHQHDLPHQRQTRAHGGHEERRELWQDHVPERAPATEPVDLGHLRQILRQAARTLPHGDGEVRDLVDGNGSDGGHLGETEPDVAQDNNHQHR